MNTKSQKIVIKNGPALVLELTRDNILEVKQTYDGMVINLRDGLHIQLTDMNMPLESKVQITESFNNMVNPETELIIDLKNYGRPTSIKA